MIWLPVVGDYADIDVYASVIAYADLLNQRGKSAKTYIPIAPNYSVPETLRLKSQENTDFKLSADDKAIILDTSVPEAIHKFVPDNQILELIDHHPGYETYWQERLGERAIIEKIGAVATSIFEWWGECWDYAKMSPEIAKLLLAAILDNTLNFNAAITTQRDRDAASKLAKLANTKVDEFAHWYFSEVKKTILDDLQSAVWQDYKVLANKENLVFGQLTIWDVDASSLSQLSVELENIMTDKAQNWILSIVCISERKNYMLASSNEIMKPYVQLLNLKSDGKWFISDQLYLRKEIIQKMLSKS